MKSIKGTPKGKKGKDGKGDGKGKIGKGKDGKGKEPCYHFAETEEGCKFGQQCAKFHRTLKPEERRCYICGSQMHMAGECDKPLNDDPPIKGSPKGDKGKDGGKGKTAKGQPAETGKGKPQINKVETEATGKEEREL